MKYVQDQMIQRQLIEVLIPHENQVKPEIAVEGFPKSNIFMSQEFIQGFGGIEQDSALILIQGTGSVRAGVWARSVCLNENLELGSMLPLIDAAKKQNMPVLVMNPNLSRDPLTKKSIPFCGTMEQHCSFVWEKFVAPSKFKKFFIVAHSAGGMCLASIQKKFAADFYKRVFKIALTDSYATPITQLN